MENLSKNGLDLIRISAKRLTGVWGKAFLASLIYVAPLIALCLIPYAGWAVSIALFGYLTLGYINYMQQLMGGKNPSLKVLFVQKEFSQAILIGIIMAVGTIVGTLLFIIPGILVIAYYSLSLFILNEERIVNVTDTLNVTAREMVGHKTAMFAYKVIFYLFYALVGVATVLGMLFVANLYAANATLAIVLGIVIMLACIVLLALITTYFYAANVVFYAEIILPLEEGYVLTSEVKVAPVVKKEAVAEAPATEEAPAEEVAPAPAAEEVKPAPAKKPAAKKTTTTKKSTTAKSTAAKKPAAKSTTATKKPAAKKTTTKTTTAKKAE